MNSDRRDDGSEKLAMRLLWLGLKSRQNTCGRIRLHLRKCFRKLTCSSRFLCLISSLAHWATSCRKARYIISFGFTTIHRDGGDCELRRGGHTNDTDRWPQTEFAVVFKSWPWGTNRGIFPISHQHAKLCALTALVDRMLGCDHGQLDSLVSSV